MASAATDPIGSDQAGRGAVPPMQATYYYNLLGQLATLLLQLQLRFAWLGADCDQRMVSASAWGDGALGGIRPIEAVDSGAVIKV